MSSVTATDSAPHLRVSAAKGQAEKTPDSQQHQPSTRVSPPESLVEDQFFWTYTEEPHRSRRQAIIKAHPEVRPSFASVLLYTDFFHLNICISN